MPRSGSSRGSSGVEQLIRNQQVVGSNPILGSMNIYKILLVGLGGSLGSMLRYISVKTIDTRINGSFPYGTLTVNLAGSFIIGIVYAIAIRKTGPDNWSVFLGAGFCGGFTTFSAFAVENLNMINQRMFSSSLVYISSSILLGILAVAIGTWIGNKL
jgi:CrcB protein